MNLARLSKGCEHTASVQECTAGIPLIIPFNHCSYTFGATIIKDRLQVILTRQLGQVEYYNHSYFNLRSQIPGSKREFVPQQIPLM